MQLLVTDGVNTVTRAFTLVIEPRNAPPTITGPADRTIREGDPVRFQLQGTISMRIR